MGTLKNQKLRIAVLMLICGLLWATLCFAVAQTSNPHIGQKRVTLIIHAADQVGNPVGPDLVKDVVATEHGKKLQVVDGPKSMGHKQIALLLDSNFHQRKVLALEQQTALEMLSEFGMQGAEALVMSYGMEIHSSGELTDDLGRLRNFTDSLRVETDRRNKTVLLYDAMKRAFDKLNDGSGTKAVVVFAEGNDHGSSIAWRSLARLAQRGHIACYVVLFADHSFYGREVRHYGYSLVELAPKTGGRSWEVGDYPRKAHETVKEATAQLDSQGLIEVLVPDIHTNRFHPVKVASKGYEVRAQTGYFDDGTQ